MPTLSEQEIERNMRAVDRAIAQRELEGLKVPEDTVADLRRVARGEIETEEVIRNIHAGSSMAPYSDDDPYLDEASGVLKQARHPRPFTAIQGSDGRTERGTATAPRETGRG